MGSDKATPNPSNKMRTATVEGRQVTIGDVVGFKCDVEQYGEIVAIRDDEWRGVVLTLRASGRFQGEYIGGDTETTKRAEDCWL